MNMSTTESGAGPELDVLKLREKLAKARESRAELMCRRSQLQDNVGHVEKTLQEVPTEDTVWCRRYQHHFSHNQKLEAELRQLDGRLAELQGESREVCDRGGEHDYSDMSEASLRQLLRRLQKELSEVEWQLKDCEWRLDQEGAAVHKAEEEKSAILTALEQVSLELDKCRRHVPRGQEPPRDVGQHTTKAHSTR